MNTEHLAVAWDAGGSCKPRLEDGETRRQLMQRQQQQRQLITPDSGLSYRLMLLCHLFGQRCRHTTHQSVQFTEHTTRKLRRRKPWKQPPWYQGLLFTSL